MVKQCHGLVTGLGIIGRNPTFFRIIVCQIVKHEFLPMVELSDQSNILRLMGPK